MTQQFNHPLQNVFGLLLEDSCIILKSNVYGAWKVLIKSIHIEKLESYLYWKHTYSHLANKRPHWNKRPPLALPILKISAYKGEKQRIVSSLKTINVLDAY